MDLQTRGLPPARQSTNRWLTAAACFAVGSYALLLPGIGDWGPTGLQVGGGCLAVLVTSVYWMGRVRESSRVPWRRLWLVPSGLFWLVTGFGFGICSLFWVAPSAVPDYFRTEDVVWALVVVTVSLWSIAIAHRFGSDRIGTRRRDRFNGLRERFGSAGLVAFAVGMSAVLMLAAMGRFSYFSVVAGREAVAATTSSLPHLLNLIAPVMDYGAFLTLAEGLSRSSRRLIVVGSFLMVLAVGFGLVGGAKGAVVFPIVATFAVLQLTVGRVPRPLKVLFAGALIVVFPVNLFYRVGLQEGSASSSGALRRALEMTQTQAGNPGVFVSDSINQILSRRRLVDSVAAIVAQTPAEIGFRSLLEVPTEVGTSLVPRFLWPQKPVTSGGYVFAVEYLGQNPEIYSFSAITMIGDLYRHGGVVVVVAGGALMGLYLAWLDRFANPNRSPARLFPYYAMVIPFAMAEVSVAEMVTQQLLMGVVAMLSMRVLLRPGRESRRPRQDACGPWATAS